MSESRLVAQISRSFRAGSRAFALETTDEIRGRRLLEWIGDELGCPVHTWSAASGIDGAGSPQSLFDLLRALVGKPRNELWILLDGAAGLASFDELRALRELALKNHGPGVVIVGDVPPRILELPELVLEHLPPPSEEEIGEYLDVKAGAVAVDDIETAEALRSVAKQLGLQLIGLELAAIERVVSEAIIEHGSDANAILKSCTDGKTHSLQRRSPLLLPAEPVEASMVGGLGAFKSWLKTRKLGFQPEAQLAHIPWPRGVLLLGVQGCGKSLAARMTASALNLPMLRLDPGRLFGGTLGESESNLRRLISSVERAAPVVLWIDEIDKGLAGIGGSRSDGGTASRVIGGFLTWLQERKRPVFVVATANDVSSLPPELLRRGRLDEIFFVDLPSADEREAVTRVHLGTMAVDDPDGSIASVAYRAEGFSGAELEAALVEAKLDAFAASVPLSQDHFKRAIDVTVPLSVSHRESLDRLRTWAKARARPAS